MFTDIAAALEEAEWLANLKQAKYGLFSCKGGVRVARVNYSNHVYALEVVGYE